MINKRLLIKNLLAHNDENSFYDKKRQLNLGDKEGKAKFLKHICALSNSNPKNNSYIVVGVKDEDNDICGVDFFDDAKLQNLINAYLDNPPVVLYENIHFPHLPEGKVVGLVTIRPIEKMTALRKNIWKYFGGSVFFRDGSISMSKVFDLEIKDVNSEVVAEIEKHAHNNIELTLDGVIDFVHRYDSNLHPQYKVFKESFVVCWAGLEKRVKGKSYFSRVDVELINEHVKLFYSSHDEVEIEVDAHSFSLIEYVRLGFNDRFKYYPLERISFLFDDKGSYQIDSEFLFSPPRFEKKLLHHIYNANNSLCEKLRKSTSLTKNEKADIINLAPTYMLCYLNGFEEAKDKLHDLSGIMKKHGESAYQSLKDTQRILRKIKYH
ncbi:MAG: ATP-binding protein [Bacteroidetes bacterium]|nr:ATP-binding protein [Bacteroidota bacterium]MDA0889004.1 ATP-binding protein [Bacteroidota bacterium]MDA1084797.1 ATP-binding protein [Bacteroidota bacterium]